MNVLDFEIIPSPSSNDHQVRIFIDGEDWLGDPYLGIDPTEFFAQNSLLHDGKLLIGRCGCGFVGCDDRIVNVERTESQVRWISWNKPSAKFRKEEYDFTIKSAQIDTSWENIGRTAERLVSQIFLDSFIEDNYKFDWASTRVKQNTVTLSFSHNSIQKLIEFEWDGQSVEDAVIKAKQNYSEIIK